MPRKELHIPPEVALAFLKDLKAFFKAKGHEADEIAARQGWLLEQHLPKGTKLRLKDVKEIFVKMRDEV